LILTNQLKPKTSYDFDYDNQITANKKYDAKRTYKHSKGNSIFQGFHSRS